MAALGLIVALVPVATALQWEYASMAGSVLLALWLTW